MIPSVSSRRPPSAPRPRPRGRLLGLATVALLAVAGCGGSGATQTGPDPGLTGAPPATAPAPPPTATPGGIGSAAAGTEDAADVTEVALEPFLDGLDQPVDLTAGPEPRVLSVVERPGRIRLADVDADGEATLRDGAWLDITDQTTTGGERGFLGIAFGPEGDWLYTHYTDLQGDTTLSAWDLAGGAPTDERVLLTVDQPYSNHNGGELAFGPDGLLYLGLGDGGSGGDPQGNGQDPSTLLGTILRIDPAPATSEGYTIPEGNPFADGDGGAPEVWAYGLRNPWRFAFGPSGEELWIADVGQNAVEEVNRIPVAQAGANFGWAALEGDEPFNGGAPADVVAPIYTYTHDEGQSVTGGRVAQAPAPLDGWYVFGDFVSGFVRALDADDPSQVVDLPVEVPGLVDFGEDPDGNLLAVSISGSIQRFVPAG